MTRARTAVALSAALLLTPAGCGNDAEPAGESTPSKSAPPPPQTLLVRGTFTLNLPNFVWSEESLQCTGRGAHDDISAGAQVIVTDPAGVNLAVGRLDAGQPVIDPDDSTRATSCLFSFKLSGVPSGKGIYGVEVSNRGKVQFNESELGDMLALGLT